MQRTFLGGSGDRILKKAVRKFSFSRDVEKADFCVVGGGPSGLSFAIRLMQLAKADNKDVRVILIEKGEKIGSHSLSGAILEPKALDELLPSWRSDESVPIKTQVKKSKLSFLTKTLQIPVPHPSSLSNKGNYVISISALTKWLSERAEELGVEVYSGFSGSELIYNDSGVIGVSTNDFGLDRNGKPKDSFSPGLDIHARATILAEGCRGSLTKKVMKKFALDKDSHQSYGLGLKEVWDIPEENYEDGLVLHTVGWPSYSEYYGGGFVYHFEGKCSVGYVVGLDYKNPTISPYREFQNFKRHPAISKYLKNGFVINYGARSLNEGGLYGIPKLFFPGGALVGCAAGFLNVLKIKGIHTSMKSGMLCAEECYKALKENKDHILNLSPYESALKKSWVYKELKESRNIRPAFNKFGLWGFLAYSGMESMILRGRAPWDIKFSKKDHEMLLPITKVTPRVYEPPDGVLTFDLLENLVHSGTNHEENQPCHLKLKNGSSPHLDSLSTYGGPEQYFCPAKVYEFVTLENSTKFQVNAQNCIHCKACDIKDPNQNINWEPPEGGGGPKWIFT